MSNTELVPRHYGSETEYSYTKQKSKATPLNRCEYPPNLLRIGLFLQNAAKFHLDVSHIEYATPECSNLDDLVAYELAGEDLVWEAYADAEIEFHKRCVTPNGKHTSGYHESYATTVDIWEHAKKDMYIDALALHFSTRTAFIGAGKPTKTKQGYAIGQKMAGISEFSGMGTTLAKALVNTRSEHHKGASSSRLKRLHVVCGDANLSPWAIRMKFGTTSCVLRLLEYGIDLSDLFLEDALREAHKVSNSIAGMNKRLRLKNGKTATALGIQEELADRTLALAQIIELPKDELETVFEWKRIIDALKTYTKTGNDHAAMKQLDWYTKYQIISARQNKEKTDPGFNARVNAVDLRYDRLPDGKGIRLRQDDHRFQPFAPTREEIEAAKVAPPDTRAKLRGRLVLAAHDHLAIDPQAKIKIGWEELEFRRKHSLGPVDSRYSEEQLDEWCEKVGLAA